jgi:protein-tyrosine phosphatase
MTTAHREIVLEHAPTHLSKTFTLIEAARLASEFGAKSIADLPALRPLLSVRDQSDIPDPIGRDPEFHAMVGSQIAGLLPPILRLCRRS